MFDLLIIVICKRVINHRISLALGKSVPVWQLRNFSVLFQVVSHCSNFSCSLFIVTKKVVNCQQTDLNCGMALWMNGEKGELNIGKERSQNEKKLPLFVKGSGGNKILCSLRKPGPQG
jgi:hypothetical protein